MPETGSITERESSLTTSDGVHIFRRSVSTGGLAWARLLIFHGYGDHSGRYVHFMRWLAERGVETHAIDFRGHGRSTGRRGFVQRWEDYFEDVRNVLLPDEIAAGLTPFVLGHSHGGLVLAAALIRGEIPKPKGCILISPWMGEMIHVSPFWRGVAAICDWTVPWLKIRSGLRDDMMSRDPAMVADSRADSLLLHCATPRWYRSATAAQADTLRRANEFRAPLLCVIAQADQVADPAAAAAFARATGSTDKTVHVIPEGRHELLRDIDSEATFNLILDWIRARSE